MHAWADVATLIKTKALNGRFVARAAADLPVIPKPGMEVAFVPPQTDAVRRSIVKRTESLGDGRYEIWFDDMGPSDAEALVGCHILIRRADIDESFFIEEPASWIGWDVVDENGASIGPISAIRENPGQDLLELEREGADSNVLVPLVDEFLVEVDVANKTITMNLPDGLLEL